MNPPLDIHCGPPDPTASPLDIVQLFALIDSHLSGEILGTYIPYIMSATVPAMEDTDKVWLQLDSGGRPIAFKKYYGGRWRRIYNGMLGEIRMFSGDPTVVDLWDSDGKGMPEKEYDGWQICNGKNGSPDLTDKFIVCGKWGTDAPAGWKTKVIDADGDAVHTGGLNKVMILHKHLPPINPLGPSQTPPQQANELILHGNEAKDTAGADHSPQFKPIIDVFYAALKTHDQLLCTYGSNPGGTPEVKQEALPTVPPFIALGFIIFVGYA